ncbi:MAG TPA: RNA methyltransferase [Terriglobales bacterium]|nr:RNA methyltransferase [Terriglobales bacterium]
MNNAINARLTRIEGRHNSHLKQLRQAFSRAERTASGACAIEGVHIVEEALRSGLRLEAVFFSESAQNRAGRLLPQISDKAETWLVPDQLFSSAVPSESPQGVAALVRMKEFMIEDVIEGPLRGLTLAVSGLQDPGNLGTILRSAEAFGAGGVLVGDNSVNLLNWKVVRASAGSIFRLPATRCKLEEIVPVLRDKGIRLIATSSHKGIPVYQQDWSLPTTVFIGSEAAGMPREILSKIDGTVMIPHSPRVESLNAGIAASIVLYEASRQRQETPTTETQRHRENQGQVE